MGVGMRARIELAITMATLLFRNKHLLALSVIVLCVAGLSALGSLPRQEDPRIVNRNPIILTTLPGASAERVETLVTEKLETALEEIDTIKRFFSTSRAGVSFISMELLDEVTEDANDAIFSEIRDKLGEAEQLLPPEASKPVFDDKRVPAAYTLITTIVWPDGSPKGREDAPLGIMNRLAEDLSDRLRGVSGTELVRVFGEPDEEITVAVDRDELADYGLTAADIVNQLRAADTKVPAGVLRADERNLFVEVSGKLDSPSRVSDVPIKVAKGGTVLRVGDVATVRRSLREPVAEMSLVNGRRAILVGARMAPGKRIDVWTPAAREVVEDFRAAAGGGISVETVFEENVFTQNRLATLVGNLLLGAGVVMVVVFLTMGWRSSILIGSALPLTVAFVLFCFVLLGAELHQMSIFGMIIALGLLIDNAIVVVDEVHKELRRGHARVDALRNAIAHLFAPLLASTFTTILAFAPIVLLPGGAGDFVGLIGGSVILAVAGSFIVSMTIIATLTALFGRAERGRRVWQSGLNSPLLARAWRGLMTWGLRHPILAILLALAPAIAGFAIAPLLGRQFFPPGDRSMFHVRVWLPEGVSVEQTAEMANRVDQALRSYEDIRNVDWMVGGSFPPVYYNLIMDKDGASNYAQGIVWATEGINVRPLIRKVQKDLDSRFPELQCVAKPFDQGPPVQADIQFRLSGPNVSTLQALGDEVRLALEAHPDVLGTQVTMPRGEPKLFFDADEDEARLTGLSTGDLARQLQSNLEGLTGGSVLEQLEELPVRVRFDDAGRSTVASLKSSQFTTRDGNRIPFEALGELSLRPESGGIAHYNGRRTNTVDAYVRDGALPIDITFQIKNQLQTNGFQLPAGYSLSLGGSLEQDGEATGNLLTYVPVLVTMTIATVILSFRSVRMAMILGVVAVASVGLALLSTYFYDLPTSFNTILGTLGLIGVALNDSIVVLAAIRANPRALVGEHDAVIEEAMGCGRHVVSTTLTTIGGFLPLLMFSTGDFWPSLSIVLAGGVGGATLLAMLYIPSAYVLNIQLSNAVRRLIGRKRSTPIENTTVAPVPAKVRDEVAV